MQVRSAVFVNGSNAVYHSAAQLAPLQAVFSANGVSTACADHLFAQPDTPHSTGPAQARAAALTAAFAASGANAVLDISGGDAANSMLEYLDYDRIRQNPRPLFGYSDMTCVLNAVYSLCGLETYLYQVRHLIGAHAAAQQARFFPFLRGESEELLHFSYRFCGSQKAMRGVVVGGNIRCFLKLAGTPYFPDCRGKILFLESCSGSLDRLEAYFAQLRQMGVLTACAGVLLGTCTEADRSSGREAVIALAGRYAQGRPLAVTEEIGHGDDARCIVIGREYALADSR